MTLFWKTIWYLISNMISNSLLYQYTILADLVQNRFHLEKKTHTLWKHPTSYSYRLYSWAASSAGYQKSMECFNGRFFRPRDLDLWSMTLTYKLDLDILPSDLHAKIQVCMSVLLARIVKQTDGQTETHTNDAKTITPITSETWGVIIVRWYHHEWRWQHWGS